MYIHTPHLYTYHNSRSCRGLPFGLYFLHFIIEPSSFESIPLSVATLLLLVHFPVITKSFFPLGFLLVDGAEASVSSESAFAPSLGSLKKANFSACKLIRVRYTVD